MSDQESTKSNTPPYVTYKTFTNFINGLRDHELPPQIDRSLMRTLSGSVQSTLLSSLKSLNLLNTDSSPTKEFVRLHAASPETEEYQEALLVALHKCYPFLSDGSLDIGRATGQQLEKKFRELGSGGSTLQKTYSFFVAISKDAGLTLSTPITNYKPTPPKKGVNNGAKNRTIKKTADNSKPSPSVQSTPPSGTFSFEIPVFGKATARISLPKDMTESEWVLIKTVIEAQASHLLKIDEGEHE